MKLLTLILGCGAALGALAAMFVMLGASGGPGAVSAQEAPDLAITISDNPDPVISGNQLTYTIAVTLTGSNVTNAHWETDTPNDTSFSSLAIAPGWICTQPDEFTSGTISCDIPTLTPGTYNFTLVVNTFDDIPEEDTITLEATTTSATAEADTTNNSDEEETAVDVVADLDVDKDATYDRVLPGSFVEFRITVTNEGPSRARDLTLTDLLPAPITEDDISLIAPGGWDCGGLGAEVVCTWDGEYPVDQEDEFFISFYLDEQMTGLVTNTASITSASTDPDLTNNEDSDSTQIVAPLLFNLGLTTTSTIPAFNGFPALTVADEDIVLFDGDRFRQYLDLSDVGVGNPIDGFSQLDIFLPPQDAQRALESIQAERGVDILSNEIFLITFRQNTTIPAAYSFGGTKFVVADHDIVVFVAYETGTTTEGLFLPFFDSSDIGLSTSAEDIDAIELLVTCDGGKAERASRGIFFECFNLFDIEFTLLISTEGSFSIPGLSGLDEDVFACQISILNQLFGDSSECIEAPEKVFDGSDAGLGSDSEDVNNIALMPFFFFPLAERDEPAERGDIPFFSTWMLGTRGNFSVPGLSGANEDAFICGLLIDPECDPAIPWFDGSTYGLAPKNLESIDFPALLFFDLIRN